MEERRLRLFESMVLRRIFWTKRDEVTGEWIRLLSGEIYELYCSPNEENEWGQGVWHLWVQETCIQEYD